MRTWKRLCRRHNIGHWRPTPIIVLINLHDKFWIKIYKGKVLIFPQIDYLILPLGDASLGEIVQVASGLRVLPRVLGILDATHLTRWSCQLWIGKDLFFLCTWIHNLHDSVVAEFVWRPRTRQMMLQSDAISLVHQSSRVDRWFGQDFYPWNSNWDWWLAALES